MRSNPVVGIFGKPWSGLFCLVQRLLTEVSAGHDTSEGGGAMERSGRSLLVPESRAAMDALKKDVLRDNALQQASQSPEAKDGGELTSRQAGKIGGPIGGSMVKRLVE